MNARFVKNKFNPQILNKIIKKVMTYIRKN